uniref:Uncharacterized protein n=1 Tax=Spongospora subterranea TaxID=70186 RepID=A0A0H5QPT2_9EUKA|eukprot:CRZ03622.1 hypothetical protein [Spongospora subterranea]
MFLDKSQLSIIFSLKTAESKALYSVLSRSSLFKDMLPIPTETDTNPDQLRLLQQTDLSSIKSVSDFPLIVRVLLCEKALHGGQVNLALEWIPKPAPGDLTGPSDKLSIYSTSAMIQALCIWCSREPPSSPTSLLGWEWESYRHIDLSQFVADLDKASPLGSSPIIGLDFWNAISSSVDLAYKSESWTQLQQTLRIVANAIIQHNHSPQRISNLSPMLSSIMDHVLSMIEWFKTHHQNDVVQADLIRRHPIHLSYGLRYSSCHDLIAQDEWLYWLWFIPIPDLDLNLIYIIFQWTIWTLFYSRSWQTLVDMCDRFDSNTQYYFTVHHMHYTIFAQTQLYNQAKALHGQAMLELQQADASIEQHRQESAKRRALKRSRLGKKEEDDKLSVLVESHERIRMELQNVCDNAKKRLNGDETRLKRFKNKLDEVERDRSLCLKRLDHVRHQFFTAMEQFRDSNLKDNNPDNHHNEMELVIGQYEKVVELARSKQESIILSRSLLDLGNILSYLRRFESARRTWGLVLESLSITARMHPNDCRAILSRIGFWNCIYGSISHYRISISGTDMSIKSRSAEICCVLALCLISISSINAHQLIDLVLTSQSPNPIFPGLDLVHTPDRLHMSDYIKTFTFAVHQVLYDNNPLYALAPLTVLLDACRCNYTLTATALVLKAQVCLALGELSEAIDIIIRLIRTPIASSDVYWRIGSTSSSSSLSYPIWNNEAILTDNASCIQAVESLDIPENALDIIKTAYMGLLSWIGNQGPVSYKQTDKIKSLAEKMPNNIESRLILARWYYDLGLYQDCNANCLQTLSQNPSPPMWFKCRSLQADALIGLGKYQHATTVLQSIIDTSPRFNEKRVRNRSKMLLEELSSWEKDLDHAIQNIESIVAEDDMFEQNDALLLLSSMLLSHDSPSDRTRALSHLQTALCALEDKADMLRLSSRINRYSPVIRCLVQVHVYIAEVHRRMGDLSSARLSASMATRYRTLLPSPDSFLDWQVLSLQVELSSVPAVGIAVEAINIVIDTDHNPRRLVPSLIALSRQFSSPSSVCRILMMAGTVSDSEVVLYQEMFEMGDIVTPVDKLDPALLRYIRESAIEFNIESRRQCREIDDSMLESVRKEIQKPTTLDVVQTLLVLRNQECTAYRENRTRSRYMQILHSFLREYLPTYRTRCCIPKIDDTLLKSFSESLEASAICFCWIRSSVSVGRIDLTIACCDIVKRITCNQYDVGQVYDLAGSTNLELAKEGNSECDVDKAFESILLSIRTALNICVNAAVSEQSPLPKTAKSALSIQKLFNIDGVRYVDDADLADAFRAIIQ